MDFYSFNEAALIFGRDPKTVAKHARRFEASGRLVLRPGLKVFLIDGDGMDVLAGYFETSNWRRRAANRRELVPA